MAIELESLRRLQAAEAAFRARGCAECHGKGYVPDAERTAALGNRVVRMKRCPACGQEETA